MFYETEEIDKLLVCMNCKNHFGVPKVLPCGSSVCEECENNIWKDIDENIDCPICKNIHQRPPSGFQINLLIEKLLKATPHCVYDAELYKKSLELLDSIGLHMDHLKLFLKMDKIEDKIQQHCNNLRKSVDKCIRDRKAKLDGI